MGNGIGMTIDPASFDVAALLALARRVLGALRAEFDRTAASLARACATGATLDSARFDQRQSASYELALASAELLAAETSVGSRAAADAATRDGIAAESAPDAFDARLSLVYAADAVGAVIARLQAIGIELDLDLAVLDRLATDAEWRALRRAVSSGPALDRLGAEIAAGHVEIGRIAFDEPLALAQDAFRRFAADVVAPQAEAIHRHDLTVPEVAAAAAARDGRVRPVDPRAVRRQRARRPRQHADDDGGDRGAVGSVARRRGQPDHAAGDPGARAARRRHRGAEASTGCRSSPPAIRCARSRSPSPTTAPTSRACRCRATRTDGGWLLNGAKTWCTFAGKAGVLMVVARTNPDRSLGHRGLSLLLVEKPSYEGHEFDVRAADGGGKLTGRAIPTIGYRGMHSFDLAFEDFFVPDANVVGGEGGLGKGFYFTMAGMVGGRMQTAARALRRDARRAAGGDPLRAGPQGVRRAAASTIR